MVLFFLCIFSLVLFIFVLEKSINNDGGDEDNHNEREILKYFEGVTHVSADNMKGLVTVTGTIDNIALAETMTNKLKRPVEAVPRNQEGDGGDDDDDGGDGDGDNNSGGGDKNKKKGAMDVQALTQRLEKKLQRKDKKGMENEEHTTVFKIALHCHGCIQKIEKLIWKCRGVTHVSVDNKKDLVTVTGTIDNIAVAEIMKERFKRPVEIVPRKQGKEEKQSDEVRNGDDDGGDGDGDNNSGGGDKNKKKGSGGDGASDGDKAEGGGGGGKTEAGSKLDYKGEGRFDYRYGYHAGFENGHPVGQLHVAHMVNGENLNGKQSKEVGNGNGDGTGSDNDNNGGGGGDDNKKRGDRGNGWIRKTKDIKITYMGQLGFGDGGGQLLEARMFCRGSLNVCSAIRSVVFV